MFFVLAVVSFTVTLANAPYNNIASCGGIESAVVDTVHVSFQEDERLFLRSCFISVSHFVLNRCCCCACCSRSRCVRKKRKKKKV
jgi:hypothetical protein